MCEADFADAQTLKSHQRSESCQLFAQFNHQPMEQDSDLNSTMPLMVMQQQKQKDDKQNQSKKFSYYCKMIGCSFKTAYKQNLRRHHRSPKTHNNCVSLALLYASEGWFDDIVDESKQLITLQLPPRFPQQCETCKASITDLIQLESHKFSCQLFQYLNSQSESVSDDVSEGGAGGGSVETGSKKSLTLISPDLAKAVSTEGSSSEVAADKMGLLTCTVRDCNSLVRWKDCAKHFEMHTAYEKRLLDDKCSEEK